MNTYITIHDYIRAVSGQETQSLVGNVCRLSAGVAVGATSLPVTPSVQVQLNVNDIVTIFDGASSEQVMVTAQANVNANSIAVQPLQYAHSSSTSIGTDGAQGSLAQSIVDASNEVEKICNQPLLLSTVTNETLTLGTTRATVNNKAQLYIRPRQFPLVSITTLSIEYSTTNIVSFDATQAIIQAGGLLAIVPIMKQTGAGQQFYQYISQTQPGNIVVSYQAGYAYTQLPQVVKRCATWLTSDILSDRQNPTGAASLQLSDKRIDTFLRGDTSGESGLYKRARSYLLPYTQEVW